MKAKITLLIAVAAAVAATLIPTSLAGQSKSSQAAVRISQSKLGRILVDGRGRTLYLFEKDTARKSMCSGSCATFWPPLLTTGKPRAGAGVKAKLLGTTRRAGGTLQVTYRGHPLYTFKLERTGQTKGEGAMDFGPPFYAVSPAGAAVVK